MKATVTENLHEQLSKKQKMLVVFGCTFLGMAMGAYGLSLSTIQGPLLRNIHGENYFSLVTTIASLAMCLMTPVGGRLTDILGSRRIIVYSSIIIGISSAILAFSSNVFVFMAMRFIMSLSQGVMASTPYILIREATQPSELPKAMGILSAGLALGSFLGSYLAGVFADMNLIPLAVLFPMVFLIAGVLLINFNVPKISADSSIQLDWMGLLWLTVALSGIFLSLNFGPSEGWGDWKILLGFACGIAGTVILILWEKKQASPLIPLQIFANRQYSMLLGLAFLSVFYMIAMNVYVPRGVQDLMGASNAASGTLQIPRTIISVILPSFAGVWIARNQKKHTWMSLAIAGACVGICFSFLVFMGPHMPLWFVILMLSFTGIADTLRSVCITPAAQSLLQPRDLGVGTSMIGFTITLSSLISSAVFGIAFDTLRNANPGQTGEIYGLDTVFLIAAVTGFLCLLLAVTVYRRMSMKQTEKTAAPTQSR